MVYLLGYLAQGLLQKFSCCAASALGGPNVWDQSASTKASISMLEYSTPEATDGSPACIVWSTRWMVTSSFASELLHVYIHLHLDLLSFEVGKKHCEVLNAQPMEVWHLRVSKERARIICLAPI